VAADAKRDGFTVVGRPVRKVDGLAKCTGQTKFADDLFFAHAVLQDPPRPRTARAHRLGRRLQGARDAGVVAVLTGKDLPIPFGILPVSQDEHALCPDRVRFVGDPVAAVAAVDEDTAFDAMNASRSNTSRFEPVFSMFEARGREDARACTSTATRGTSTRRWR